MKNLKLTIDLLPRGAWDTNLSRTLPQSEWDTLRNNAYERAGNKCAICGRADAKLDAHEVWDFNVLTATQTLVDIVALCPACHGVKHMRHSEMTGHGEQARTHFMRVNNCDYADFAEHYLETQRLFNERSTVKMWTIKRPIV